MFDKIKEIFIYTVIRSLSLFDNQVKKEQDNCKKCDRNYCDQKCNNELWFKWRFIIK